LTTAPTRASEADWPFQWIGTKRCRAGCRRHAARAPPSRPSGC
jgi:hypothetical protein